ncbi:hypothetical protein HaLaN_16479 [Haematococcus lacustris]|uniref:Leishmanolysin-like peptidase n=1 Tax=Haematococcus lacustris TaxID=44745 RepID=A0A699YP65_HAELA|nr:hypothetical protein HaLaN_07496 [Haematococcus lacustris]GFH19522.1 hypothetical protein HaLaN_16479 [Haematococcus lacustris]
MHQGPAGQGGASWAVQCMLLFLLPCLVTCGGAYRNIMPLQCPVASNCTSLIVFMQCEILVEAQLADGDLVSVLLQNAETVRLVGSQSEQPGGRTQVAGTALVQSSVNGLNSRDADTEVGSVDAPELSAQWRAVPVTQLQVGHTLLVHQPSAGARHMGLPAAVTYISVHKRGWYCGYGGHGRCSATTDNKQVLHSPCAVTARLDGSDSLRSSGFVMGGAACEQYMHLTSLQLCEARPTAAPLLPPAALPGRYTKALLHAHQLPPHFARRLACLHFRVVNEFPPVPTDHAHPALL